MTEKEEENSKEENEESELEEEIKENEEEMRDEDEIFDEDIVEFIPSAKSNPSLGKIDVSEEPITLEANLRATTHLPVEEDEEKFKYGNVKNSDEPKYQNFDGDYSATMMTSFDKIQKEGNRLREVGLIESSEARISPEKDFERYEQVKRFDREEFKKNESERREIKYKPLN